MKYETRNYTFHVRDMARDLVNKPLNIWDT